jgi:hypothetical protein
MADQGRKSIIEETMNESPNTVTARNAGWPVQALLRGLHQRSGVREFRR